MMPNYKDSEHLPKYAIVTGFVIEEFPEEIRQQKPPKRQGLEMLILESWLMNWKPFWLVLDLIGMFFAYSGGAQKLISGN